MSQSTDFGQVVVYASVISSPRFVIILCTSSVVCKLFTFSSSQKPLNQIKPNLAQIFLGGPLQRMRFCYDWNLNMADKANNASWLAENLKIFSSKTKRPMHWIFFARVILGWSPRWLPPHDSLTKDPMGKTWKHFLHVNRLIYWLWFINEFLINLMILVQIRKPRWWLWVDFSLILSISKHDCNNTFTRDWTRRSNMARWAIQAPWSL